ncbi:MAG TPA: ADP-ribosylation factor-like protein [Polyangiaceae bacterium]|nr:ADP-ribosylation factor-like protein [Polyangiaceae bacterium]
MPSYDSARDCHVLRIVYDGPGLAGKTTNLQQICALVPARRRSEMYTPAELKGRTMFFDWMEVDAPPQGGKRLKVQLITVPGQIQRNYRRRPLVEMADVVVFVCDCTKPQVPDTLRTFARLRNSVKRRSVPVPVIVQANKQDDPEALPVDKLRRRLRLDDDVPVISAVAVAGQGVRETLVTAMRIGIERMGDEEIVPLASAFANADALFDHVLSFEDNPVNDDVIDAEELHVGAEDVDLTAEGMAAHLSAASMDALESKARRAALRAGETDEPESPSEEEVPATHGGRRSRRRARG